MAIDRQSIEKRDFPIARRGYDPAAVDAHLAQVASEVASIQRDTGRRPADSLASAASEHVRAIVAAAEQTAADIEHQATESARRVHEEARGEADRTRNEAIERAQDHVSRVSQATALMLQRVDAMESELGALIESLRTGANRLSADLSLLEGNMAELYGAASVGTMPEGYEAAVPVGAEDEFAEAAEPEFAEPVMEPEFAEAELEEAELEEAEPEEAAPEEAELDFGAAPTRVSEVPSEPEPTPAPGPEAALTPPSGTSADAEGARLIALNMALNGQSREETDRYLAENFDLADRARLLDEVYSSIE